MTVRYYILESDTTTAGGVVQQTANTLSFKVYGKEQSYIGDDVWCPACQSMGKIIPDQDRLSTKVNGRMPALNDDLCLCKCNPPPKLVHSQTSFREVVDDGYNTQPKNHKEKSGSKIFDKRIKFDFGEINNDIIPFLRYRLKIDGVTYEGELDDEGNTDIFYSEKIAKITDLELFLISTHEE